MNNQNIYSFPSTSIIDSILSAHGIVEKKNLSIEKVNHKTNIKFIIIKNNTRPLIGITNKNNKKLVVYSNLNKSEKISLAAKSQYGNSLDGLVCDVHDEYRDPECILSIQQLEEIIVTATQPVPDMDEVEETLAYIGSDMDYFEFYWLHAIGWFDDLFQDFYQQNEEKIAQREASGEVVRDDIEVDGPDLPIEDPNDFLDCFDTTQNAIITVYALEPDPGTGKPYVGRSVGHTFVSIQQGNNISTFGYYPVSDYIVPKFNNSSAAILGNDGIGNQRFTASISTTVNGSQLQQILNATINFNPTYHLDTYNCTDFAIELGNLAGMNLPECNGTWKGGGDSNPGRLGSYIRKMHKQNSGEGNAPATNKDC